MTTLIACSHGTADATGRAAVRPWPRPGITGTTPGRARTLARAALRVEALADKLDREASEYLGRPVHSQAGDRIRAALNGETA